MVRVKVKISKVAVMGTRKVYKTGEEFECSEEMASSLRNAVTVLAEAIADTEQTDPEPPGRKRR